MERPPPGYPMVPGSDVETPPDSKSQQPPQQPQAPTPPNPLYPGGGAAYLGGPAAYPPIPPAGNYMGGATPTTGYPAYTTTYPTPYEAGPQVSGAQPQQPQQQSPLPVLGEYVSGFTSHPVWGPDDKTRDNRFAIVAWICFLLGFVFPIFWFVSVLLPCCLPSRHVRWAAMASAAASLIYLILAVVLAPTMRMRHHD